LYLKKPNISNYIEKGKTMEARDLLSRNLSVEVLRRPIDPLAGRSSCQVL
jgi:hypothetical protein